MRRWRLVLAGFACFACAPSATTYRGHYVFGHEVEAFTPCGAEEDLWVVGDPTVLEPLQLLHDSLTDAPYEVVWVEIRGRRLPGKGDGHAEHYDGLIQFDSVVVVGKQGSHGCGPKDESEAQPKH